MPAERFDVRFDEDAKHEYNRLDGSVLRIVNEAIDGLVERADEIGTTLRNNSDTKLAGCREIKLRDAGIRIVYRLTDQVINVLRIVFPMARINQANTIQRQGIRRPPDQVSRLFLFLSYTTKSTNSGTCILVINDLLPVGTPATPGAAQNKPLFRIYLGSGLYHLEKLSTYSTGWPFR